MRALLVVNPKATATSGRSQGMLARTLHDAVDLRVAYTRRRGHAVSLARQATQGGLDLVITLGGDGTINEVVNGLMTAAGGHRRPALAVIPGGSTNVFARALGLPADGPAAVGLILAALREGRSRLLGLGLADERYFTFCAGFGLDAAVIRRVERARLGGRTSTPALYIRALVSQFLRDWQAPLRAERHAPISVEAPGEPVDSDLAMVVVQNTAPWTYLGGRPIHASPQASFDLGLDLLGLRGLRLTSTVRLVAQMLARTPDPRGGHLVRLHDLAELTLRASRPQPFQVDGDYLGERDKVRIAAVPGALRVIC